ncbi:MAG TPA: IS4 family transposase [Ktedonobacteraceae bacterium]|nr:IS4 family transposase [Ktedonobacteraceae bacterium]
MAGSSIPSLALRQLARFARSLGVKVSKQAIFERLTERTANWLLSVLQQAVQTLLFTSSLSVGLLARFPAVVLEDTSCIEFPSALARYWKGSGGRASPSALKLAVRWDLRSGRLQGPMLYEGRDQDSRMSIHALPLPQVSVWVADAAYYSLKQLRQMNQQGVVFVIRPRGNLAVSRLDGQRLDLVSHLPTLTDKIIDLPVRLGSIRPLWLNARIIAFPVTEEVAQKRRQHLLDTAKRRGHAPSAEALALAAWTLIVTNASVQDLSAEEALLLFRARWQVELLFKLWKSHGHVDEWASQLPEHILCEVYAKLLAMLVEHWVLLESCWDDPHRNWMLCADLLRDQLPLLLLGLRGCIPLSSALHYIRDALLGNASIPARSTRPSTSHQLLDGGYWGIT